ncbi:hypothetical protein GJ632_08300, partial [Halogeometricum sp. CBA1124]
MSAYSRGGPTADGRRGVDVVAPTDSLAGVAALAGCAAVGTSALPSPNGAAYSDVAHVRESHRDAAVG